MTLYLIRLHTAIYLSESFLASASLDALVAVVLEEIGHFVDAQVNAEDSAGDEGEIFSGIVQGKVFESEQLKLLKAEDDHAIVSLDGKLVAIEQAQPVSESGGEGGNKLKVFTLDPLPQGTTERNVTLTYRYEHFSIPDQFELRYGKGKDPLFSTEKPVSGSKAGIVVFKQVQGQDTVNIEVIAPQEGTAWNFTVSNDAKEIPINGLLGDVIEIDLGKKSGSITLKSIPSSLEAKGKLIDKDGKDAVKENTYGVLYYVPIVSGESQEYGKPRNTQKDKGLGEVTFDVEDQDQKSITVKVNVTDGFSKTDGSNPVKTGTGELDIYTQRQRLAYLGFPGSSGSPLVVDGQSGGNTEWAIKLFNSVVSSSSKVLNEKSFSKDNAKQLINATNAPRWTELKSTSIPRVGIVQGSLIELWASNWTYDVLNSVVPSNPNINFNVNGTSLKKGGDTSAHSGHEAGMDLDIDTAGKGDGNTYAPNNMFFKENKFGTKNTWYVEAPDGKVIIKNTNGKYESADPNVPANLTKAITGLDIYNKQVIKELFSDTNNNGKADQDEWLIIDNPNAVFNNANGTPTKGYVLADTRNLITSFLNANVGGITVKEVYFNDPRTWDIDPKKVRFASNHNGHVHFTLKAPSATTNSNQRFSTFSFASESVEPVATDAITVNNFILINNVIDIGKIEGNFSTTGSINTGNPETIYRFTLGYPVDEDKIDGIYFSTSRNFNLLLNQLAADADVELIKDFNGDGIFQDEDVIASSNQLGNNPETLNLTDLNESDYYIRIFQKGGDTSFNLSLTVPPLPVPTDNAGNTVTNAKNLGIISNNVQQSDFIGQVDADDYYRFTLSSISDLTVDVTDLVNGDLFAEVGQDKNNDGILDFDEIIVTSDEEGDTSEQISRTGLAAGDYILHLGRNSGNTNYNLNLSATPSVIPPDKAGSTLTTAFNLGTLTASTQNDFVGNVDPIDYYRFTLTNPSGVTLNLSGLSADADLELSQDKDGDGVISSDEVIQLSEGTDNQDENINITALPAGDYFVKVSQYEGDTTYNLALTPTAATGVDLQVSVTPVTNSLTLGDQVSYTITVKNIGASNATGVTLSDNLPLENILDVSAVASKGTRSISSSAITANIGSLNVNESATVVVSGRLVGSGSTSSLIQVSSAQADFNPDNDSVVQRFNVAPGTIQPADLELSLTSDKTTANIDDLVTFKITLTNKGPGAATSIQVKNVLPQGLTLVSSNPQQGSYNSTSGIWEAGNIAKDNQAFVDIVTKVTSGGSLSNTAEVIAVTEPDPDSTPNNNNPNEDDQASVIVTIGTNENPSNQAPTNLALSATTVNENVPVNTVIGTFSTTDPDTGNTFTYSLVAGTGDTDNSAFSIVGNQLQINNSPDFETKNSYSIRVKTTDQGGLSFEKTLTITVNDVNETPGNQAPTNLALSATTVNENVAPNTVIGTFSSTDPDTGNSFIYSLVTGTGDTDNSAFSIIGNQLQINNSPDFETKNSYSIRVKTTDQGGLSFEKTLTIAVNDVNETPSNQAPTNLALSATTVNENVAPNTVIGTFSSTDPDSGNSFTYSLVTGTGDTDNSAFSIVGNQLQINNSPDFETKNSYSIRVKTTDQGGLSFEKTLTIVVNDVNETPSNQAPTALIFQNAVTQLAENVNVTPEFKVADLLIEDDGLGTNNLFLTGRDRERFLIQNSALFYVGFTPNFEAQNSYEVTVNVDDTTVGVTPDLTQTLTLNITDINEAPTALILTNSTKAIAENTDTSQGVKVADIQISDDALGTNSLSLLGSDQSSFQIRGRELFFIGKADFEAQSLYNLTVAVTDKLLRI
ncbi:MAG: cadherin domain-containing protein [Microcystis sp. M090S1]|nr:cadherin domain-containing protein [Microcystis sp. M090S1]